MRREKSLTIHRKAGKLFLSVEVFPLFDDFS